MKNIINLSLLKISFSLFIILILGSCNGKNEIIVKSPDSNITVKIERKKVATNTICYSVTEGGENVILDSPLGLEFKKTGTLSNNLEIVSVSTTVVNDSWNPVYGEKNRYIDNYNETILQLKETIPPFRSIHLTFRVYNEGVAFRYTVNSIEGVTLTKELTGFRFAENNFAWLTSKAQGVYEKSPISKIDSACETPLVIEMNNKTIALGEAALVNHAKIKLYTSSSDSLMLNYNLASEVSYDSTFSTPWRYVMIADSPGELLENNGFILNLNEPVKIENTDWIKPGKIIREVTLTTKGAKACVDFADKHNLQYIEFDAGWYGHEYKDEEDASTVTVDPDRSPGPLDLPEVVKYAEQKDIGVILYVNRRALEKQLDELLPLYKSWGIKGLKYGFVNVGPQEWTQWLHDAVRKAADHELMVDIHDGYRPSGYSRTYPNLMTQEGIRGDEESPSVEHTIITLFTRMIAGAADNTNCYLASRVSEKMGGKTAQMAKSIMLYSPWQFLYWYDRPEGSPVKKGGAGMTEGVIEENEALGFYDALPTVWDDTKVLEGKIGEFATVARRNVDDWFVGALAANTGRKVEIPLTFLETGKTYEVTIFSQNALELKDNKVNIKKIQFTNESIITQELVTNSGFSAIIRKL